MRMTNRSSLSAVNLELLVMLEHSCLEKDEILVGDFVVFADGITHRVAHLFWDRIQTASCGSFYMGKGFREFSGSLFLSTPRNRIEPEMEGDVQKTAPAPCWFWDNGWPGKDRGITVASPCKVWICSINSPHL